MAYRFEEKVPFHPVVRFFYIIMLDKKIRGAEAPLRARWATEGLFEVDVDEANETAE